MIQRKSCEVKATKLSLDGERNKSPTLIYQLELDWSLSDQKTMRSIYEV